MGSRVKDLSVTVKDAPSRGTLDIDEAGNFTYTADDELARERRAR
jgi:VCBS repeat-containing protein